MNQSLARLTVLVLFLFILMRTDTDTSEADVFCPDAQYLLQIQYVVKLGI